MDGVWRAPDLTASLRATWRAWAAAGGDAAMKAEEARRERLRDARLVAAIGDARGHDMTQEARSSMACWVRGAVARLARPGMHVQRRHLREAMLVGGMDQDGRGRHAVARVLEWRGESLATREGLVRWEGFDVSVEGGGAAWEDTWVPWARLTPDLQEEGRLRPRVARKRKAEVAAEVVAAADGAAAGVRRSARLSAGAFSVVMYESGERAIVRRGLVDGHGGAGAAEAQGHDGGQERETTGDDEGMEEEAAGSSGMELECTTFGGCSGHEPAARQESRTAGSLQDAGMCEHSGRLPTMLCVRILRGKAPEGGSLRGPWYNKSSQVKSSRPGGGAY